MAALRTKIPDFELANPQYVGAQVSFFSVDVNGQSTGQLATLYVAPTGPTTAPNPQTLDSEGKFSAPVYIDNPVIAQVTGANVGSHSTGVISPLRGGWESDWITGTVYQSGDLVRHPTNDNIYVATRDFTARATIAADIAAGDLDLVFDFATIGADAASLAAAVASASSSATSAASSASSASSSASSASSSASSASSSATSAASSATAAAASAAAATSAARGLNIINGKIVESRASNAVTFAIKTLAGNDPSSGDPVLFVFVTSTGTIQTRSVTAPLSITVSSGSTLGAVNATPFRVWLVAFDDAGTVRLGIINCLSGTSIFPLGNLQTASSTAEGGVGAADVAHQFYSTVAVTAKPYSVIGYASYEDGLATAGIWNAAPTNIRLFDQNTALPGSTVQVARNFSNAFDTTTSSIPADDTIPQNTEGKEYITQALTPTSKVNLLAIDVLMQMAETASADCIVALFQDSGADAIAAQASTPTTTNYKVQVAISHVRQAKTVALTTFRVRYGPAAGATTTVSVNGIPSGRNYGGAVESGLQIRELMT